MPSRETAVFAAAQKLPFAVALADPHGIVTWANAAFAQLTLSTPEELIGQPVAELPLDEILRAPGSSESWLGTAVCRRKTGEVRPVELSVTALRAAGGEVTGFWIMNRDSAGPGRESGAQCRVEAQLSALIESTQDLIWSVDCDFRLLTFNDALRNTIERSFGARPAAGVRIEDMLPPARAALWPPMYRRALTEGPFRAEHVLADGRTLELAFNRILHAGQTTGISVFGKDITERKTAENALREAEGKYRAIFENALEGIFRATLDGKGLAGNPALVRMLGYDSPADFLSQVTDMAQQVWVDPEERSRYVQLLERQGSLRGFECRMQRKDGRAIWVAISVQKISGQADQPAHYEAFIEDISQRKAMEEALRQSEEKFAKAFRRSPAIMLLTDQSADGRIVDVNETFERITGYSREDAVGRTSGELGLWADPRDYENIVTLFRPTGRLSGLERSFRTKAGDILTGLISGERIEVAGKPYAIWSVIDITERNQVEARLQAEHDRLQRIIEHADAGYFRIGLDGRYEELNPAWLRMYEFSSREEAIGLHFSAIEAPEDVARVTELVEALLLGGPAVRGDFSRLRRDGTFGYLSFSASPAFDCDRVIGIEGFLLDTSDRMIAERERERTARRYRSLFDSMQEGTAIHKLIRSGGRAENYVLLEVNRRFEEILGVGHDCVVGKLATEVYGSPEAPYLKQYASVVETGTPLQFETYFPPMDKHFLISVAPMGDDDFATIFFDITGQRKAAEGMRSLVTAIEQAGETIVITDLKGTIQYCNPAFEKVSGYSKREALGRNPRLLKSGKHGDEFYARMWATITKGKVWAGRLTNRKKDGTLFEEDATISPIRDADDRITGFVAVKRDVTEQLELERQFRQAQKLESLGRLAGGVAHDFNNLLTVINGYSDLLLKLWKAPDPLRFYAEEIRTAGGRAASLTKQLLAFSRKQVIEPGVVDLNATIRESAPMLQRLIGEDVALVTRLDDSLGRVMADPDQMHQVIMNLAVNARDAMPDGGKLEIETGNADLAADGGSAGHPDAVPGRYVLMAVTDTGHGIDDAIRQHIFEPFFTTKEEGKGTGLGLSTVYGIVRQSGGWIEVRSEVGVGSSFQVYLPRVDAAPAEAPSPACAAADEGSETILLVEDQAAVRALIKSVLEQSGYHVLEAGDGDEAMAVAGRFPGDIHLLVSDVVLPGMNGKELSECLQTTRSNLKVLFISGYTANVVLNAGAPVGGVEFLRKPFTPDELAAKVRQVLAGRIVPEDRR